MDKKLSVLFVGESWFVATTETKGADSFTVSRYEENDYWVGDAVREGGMAFTHIPCHRVEYDFPQTVEALKAYDVVMLSDVGANTFLLPSRTFINGQCSPNLLEVISQYVNEGGALCMIGGYMTFQGFEGKGSYRRTAIEALLPVNLQDGDDRAEFPQGFAPEIIAKDHPVFQGIPAEFPNMLGYNRTFAKPEAQILAKHGEDPIIAVCERGQGRVMAYACDCAPHWASPELCEWSHYRQLWRNIVRWLAKENG